MQGNSVIGGTTLNHGNTIMDQNESIMNSYAGNDAFSDSLNREDRYM